MSKRDIIKELKNLKEIISIDGINAKKEVKERINKLIRIIENRKI